MPRSGRNRQNLRVCRHICQLLRLVMRPGDYPSFTHDHRSNRYFPGLKSPNCFRQSLFHKVLVGLNA